jgi:hypothetical protein
MEARKSIDFRVGKLSCQIGAQIKIEAVVQHFVAVLVPISHGSCFSVSGHSYSQYLALLQEVQDVVQMRYVQIPAVIRRR